MIHRLLALFSLLLLIACAAPPQTCDIVIRNGSVYDGTGSAPVLADVCIDGDLITHVGSGKKLKGAAEIDATGKAVTPGFINMLSWATESLIHDGESQSDIRQGVTLEVFGEGWSMGPLSPEMKARMQKDQSGIAYPIEWTTLGEYLEFLEKKGVSTNIASYVGATTLRIHEIGYEDREPTPEELQRMTELAAQAMREGALGIGSSLIYAPAFYAKTSELTALCKAVAPFGGRYISHMRSESNRLLEAMDELIQIAEEAGVPAEIYHLKAAGKPNHGKLDAVIQKIEQARARGLEISANMYTYVAGATGLNASMPPWVQEGGFEKWAERLKDPRTRLRVAGEMAGDTDEWENLYYFAGPENMILVGFKNKSLRNLIGKTLAEVAVMRGTSPEETAMDLVVEDGSRVGTVYFLMTEENVKRQIKLPYMTFGSDGSSLAPEGVFLEGNPHPRAYGNFARLLGKYVREENVIPLEEAIHKLTWLAASRLGIRERGKLEAGFRADVVVFDPATISDHATFEKPHAYSTGVHHVLVNGVQVLKDGEHTGATPGRVVRGPGWEGWQKKEQ
ncbi:MAG: D-aminoacylase [Acidobacteriota bacterium]|nr:D-aminoacylase [Acidobacteriota bacterium]